jgi:hypothetical protein
MSGSASVAGQIEDKAVLSQSSKNDQKNQQISQFGFSFERGGAHSSRTMMVEELASLLNSVSQPRIRKERLPLRN